MDVTAHQIRHEIMRFVDGEASLRELHRYITPLLWRIPRAECPDAFALATQVSLYLSEYSHGHRTEDDMRALLESLAGASRTG